jgi:hypothetical protein
MMQPDAATPTTPTIIAVYTTRGDVGAYLVFPYLYNPQGEWIGWVTAERQVYSVHGHYVGRLSSEPRILRKRSSGYLKPRRSPPPRPRPIRPPARSPLAPMMAELSSAEFDVLEDSPDMLPPVDFGDLREDLD